ncbi:hypothetical protein PULV_a3971 [Pseudoalteromonas ulvae UL12]|nr:hypothetical protein [Pseudoalteromonas ulvae UL12]
MDYNILKSNSDLLDQHLENCEEPNRRRGSTAKTVKSLPVKFDLFSF